MKLRGIIALTLLAALMLTALAACGGEAGKGSGSGAGEGASAVAEADTTAETTAAETTDPYASDGLPDTDWQGADYTIILRELTKYEFVAEEENGEVLNDAIFERNRRAEERFNIKIGLVTKGGWASATSEMLSTFRASILAGESTYDLGLGYQAFVVEDAMAGLFHNAYEVPYLDLSKPWWCQQAVEILTLDNCCYMLTGDISHTVWRGMYVLFFNKKLAEDHKIGSLYDKVSAGDWLFDDFVSISKSVSADLNGDGEYTDADLYGWLTCLANHIRQFMVSLDTPITTPDKDGYPVLTFNNPKSVDVLERVNALYWDQSTYISKELQEPAADAISPVFTGDRALFMSAFLGNAELLRDMDTDFGIIPYPKYDEAQADYYTGTHNSVSTVLIPVTVADVERAGMITEALCFDGYKTIVPAYYEVVLKTKFARDEESEAMLDIIRGGLSFNFGWVHSIPMSSVGAFYSDLVAKNSTDFASYYASYEPKLLTALERITAKYKEVSGK